MRILAVVLGAAAALAVAAPVAADPAIGGMRLAQAQDSGSQSGSSMGAKQQGSSGASQKQGGSGMSQQGSSGMNQQGNAGQGGSRTTVGVGSRASDDVVIRRNKFRRHVYAEPSTTVIRKKKRYVRYHEPSS